MKSRVGWVVGIVLAAGTILVLATLTSKDHQDHTRGYRVVSILALEGLFKSYSENVRAGINAAGDEILEKDNARVDVSFRPFDGDPEKARELLRTAVTRDGHRFVVEVFGTAALLNVCDFVNQNGAVVVSGVNTGHLLTEKMGRFVFRIIPSDGDAVRALLSWASELRLRRGAVVSVTTDWGKGIAEMVTYYAPNYGIEVIGDERVDKAYSVFEPQVAKLKADNAEVVFLALNPDQAGNFVRALADAKYQPAVLGTDNLTAGEFTESAGDTAEGVRYVLPPASTGGTLRPEVTRRLRARLGLPRDQEPHPFAYYGYDAMWTLYRAMRASNSDPDGAVTFLESYRADGATGPIEFTKEHDLRLAGPHQRIELRRGPEGRLVSTVVQ